MKLIVLLVTWTTLVTALNVTQRTSDTRIVGGSKALIRDHPHLVQLLYKGSWMCGGSLLTERHVVTASHCVQQDAFSPQLFSIRAGSSIKGSGGKIRKVIRIWMHPNYNSETLDNDVAVMKLSFAVKGAWIKPISLATTRAKPGQTVQVAGWGSTDPAEPEYPNALQSVAMTIVSKQKCREAWGGGINQRKVCALESEKGFCFGDSGGPLTFKGELHGIISYVSECGSTTIPSVAADVVMLKSFINAKLKL